MYAVAIGSLIASRKHVRDLADKCEANLHLYVSAIELLPPGTAHSSIC